MKIGIYSVTSTIVLLLLTGTWVLVKTGPPALSGSSSIARLEGSDINPPDVFEETETSHESSEVERYGEQGTMKIVAKPAILDQAHTLAVGAPHRVPELPVILPLEALPASINSIQGNTQYLADRKFSVPARVMERFIAETGLTQDEIEQAMNR